MNTINDVWHWYQESQKCLKATSRLAAKHWSNLGADHFIFKDNRFKELADIDLWFSAELALQEMEDQAILMLFASFEAQCRHRLQNELSQACSESATTPAISVMAATLDLLEEGSFRQITQHFFDSGKISSPVHEQLGSLRSYRNWLAHGKTKRKPCFITAHSAYALLTTALAGITSG